MVVNQQVVVVGSGIIGASVALACQDLGAEVTVLDKGPLGGIASGNSFGWINASFAENQAYFNLRNEALERFRALDQRLSLENHMRWQGTLWWEDVGRDFAEQFQVLTKRGYPSKLLKYSEIEILEPHLREVPNEAILTATEGAAQAKSVACAILDEVKRNGGTVRGCVPVTSVRQAAGRVCSVQTEVGELLCDVVVLATGAAAQNVLSGLDWTLPMANNAGIILQTDPLPQVIQHVLMTPDVHFRQNLDGSFVAGEIFNGEINPNVSAIALASEIISRIQAKLRNIPKLRLAEAKIGIRPVPLDGMPVIGAVPGLVGAYTAIMHSGVTLGPFVGQLLASEILDGYESPLLKLFRPVRFA